MGRGASSWRWDGGMDEELWEGNNWVVKKIKVLKVLKTNKPSQRFQRSLAGKQS